MRRSPTIPHTGGKRRAPVLPRRPVVVRSWKHGGSVYTLSQLPSGSWEIEREGRGDDYEVCRGSTPRQAIERIQADIEAIPAYSDL